MKYEIPNVLKMLLKEQLLRRIITLVDWFVFIYIIINFFGYIFFGATYK